MAPLFNKPALILSSIDQKDLRGRLRIYVEISYIDTSHVKNNYINIIIIKNNIYGISLIYTKI